MLVTLLTNGTRGDTQPMIVLADELQRRGHRTRIAASPNTLDLVRACGIEALPFGPDSQELMESDEGRRWLAAGDVRAFTKELTAVSHRHLPTTVQEARAACEGADLIVAGLLAEDLADVMAQAREVPLVTLHSAPMRTTQTYPHPLVTTRHLPGRLNRATGALFDRVWFRGFRGDINALRREAGLPAVSVPLSRRRAASGEPELQAYDPAVAPVPDFDQRRPLTGFLTLDGDLARRIGPSGVDGELDSWLGAGDPPVFFGFGSMPVRDPAATLRLIVQASRTLGVRALVSAGWGRLTSTDHDDLDVRLVDYVDHDAVLARCRAAVHHGGAGTTAASLRAGVPTIVCSVFADQPFWGTRVVDLGAGAALRFADLSAATLQAALRSALTGSAAERAAELGAQLISPRNAAQFAVDAVLGAASR